MSYPDRLIDKRVVDRYIAKGMVNRDQYQSTLDALPDMEHNAATVLEEEAPEEASAEPTPEPAWGSDPFGSP